MIIKRGLLKKAKPENVIRLAIYLKLYINKMSINQIIGLIYWRLSRTGYNRH